MRGLVRSDASPRCGGDNNKIANMGGKVWGSLMQGWSPWTRPVEPAAGNDRHLRRKISWHPALSSSALHASIPNTNRRDVSLFCYSDTLYVFASQL